MDKHRDRRHRPAARQDPLEAFAARPRQEQDRITQEFLAQLDTKAIARRVLQKLGIDPEEDADA
jgi:hypothetical protein